MSLAEKLKSFEEQLQQVPPEKQQEKLNELLSTLSQEELEELKKQQCVLCGIIDGKIPATKIYEDQEILAVLDINPASAGHTIVFPKTHAPVLAMVADNLIGKLFITSNAIAKAQFDALKAEGTNIHVSSGAAAGQTTPHVLVNVIPRYQEDGIKFEWTFGKSSKEELHGIAEKLKEKLIIPQEEEPEPETDSTPETDEEEIPERIP